MKVLVVGVDLETFVLEQCNALKEAGIHVLTYKVTEHNLYGYLKEILNLRKAIRQFHPDLIHAHYGLCGLCANFQRKVPVVTTFHGSDIHSGGWLLLLSKITMRLSSYNIFVSKKLYEIAKYKRSNASVIPCGIDLKTIYSISRNEAKKKIDHTHTFVLFAGSFKNRIKNPELAKKSMSTLSQIGLIELSGYTREEVNLLMNATDCLLMTSYREGSPQVIKEAMTCGTPIVSVDVGDVKDILDGTEGCFIAKRDTEDIAEKIKLALAFHGKTNGQQRILNLRLDNKSIAQRIIMVYQLAIKNAI